VFLVLLLHLGCTTNQRSIPFGYLLQLLAQGHKCPLVCFVEFLQFLPGIPKNQETVEQEQLKKVMEMEKRGQQIRNMCCRQTLGG